MVKSFVTLAFFFRKLKNRLYKRKFKQKIYFLKSARMGAFHLMA
jgi:hypothetical protein